MVMAIALTRSEQPQAENRVECGGPANEQQSVQNKGLATQNLRYLPPTYSSWLPGQANFHLDPSAVG